MTVLARRRSSGVRLRDRRDRRVIEQVSAGQFTATNRRALARASLGTHLIAAGFKATSGTSPKPAIAASTRAPQPLRWLAVDASKAPVLRWA
jgi:hypothetical protein